MSAAAAAVVGKSSDDYVLLVKMLYDTVADTDSKIDISSAYVEWRKSEAATESAVVDDSTTVLETKQAFIDKSSMALKGRSDEEIYTIGEKVAMMYSFMKSSETSDDALEKIHPIGTDSFKDVLSTEGYTTFMNGWQNIIDGNPPSEFTLNIVRKDVEVTVEKEKKIKEEADKRFALNIRRKVTATQAALAGKKKLEKAGMVFEEGEGVTLIKRPRQPKPEPEPEPLETEAASNTVETDTPSGGVGESKDD
jgi:hypothetical protein